MALPEWPWRACSSPGVPGAVGSFIHSALSLATTLAQAQPQPQWQLGSVAEILLAIGGTAYKVQSWQCWHPALMPLHCLLECQEL